MKNSEQSAGRGKQFSFLWLLAIIFAVFWLVIAGAPFLFQVFTSMKNSGEFITGGLFAPPEEFSFANYAGVMRGGFYKYFFNSVIVLAVTLTLTLLISACAAYPLARMRFLLNKPIFSAIVATMSIPIHVTLIPIFILCIRMGVYDSLAGIIGPQVAFHLPMSIFILTAFMQGISREMEEAAEIDGCGKFATFFKVIFPLSRSGLATLAIYNGVVIWNEFIFVMVLTQSQDSRTLPLAIWEYQGQYSMDTPLIMALLVLSSLPVILLYVFGQDKLVKGMMAGAVKG
ncbi:MAG: carbohydrate ABC transporter permease [Treponema sp.]|jgi:raffinose/stachyose/melibiose transport system permease protein|nr:carbohydrate ABC transporter permease [Treponema sp.]